MSIALKIGFSSSSTLKSKYLLVCLFFADDLTLRKLLVMYKLIYYVPEKPYGTIDSSSQIELIGHEAILNSEQITVVCVVDYAKKVILNKCNYYDMHRELIDDLIFARK